MSETAGLPRSSHRAPVSRMRRSSTGFCTAWSSTKVVQVNDDGKLTLDPLIPGLFRALGVGLTQLQQYDAAAVICHPRFEESRRTGDFPDVFVVMPFRQDLRA